MIGKVGHEELLMGGGVIQLGLLPALVPGHEVGEETLGVVQLVVKVRELAHLVGVTVGMNLFNFPVFFRVAINLTSSWDRTPVFQVQWCMAHPKHDR